MQAALDISVDNDMDWECLGRDKSTVIYQDKLMTDAALFGCPPIKMEHSYSLKSLNSDGDSIPDSPRSLQNKIDGRFSLIYSSKSFSIV